jgi:hypothetical protein
MSFWASMPPPVTRQTDVPRSSAGIAKAAAVASAPDGSAIS